MRSKSPRPSLYLPRGVPALNRTQARPAKGATSTVTKNIRTAKTEAARGSHDPMVPLPPPTTPNARRRHRTTVSLKTQNNANLPLVPRNNGPKDEGSGYSDQLQE